MGNTVVRETDTSGAQLPEADAGSIVGTEECAACSDGADAVLSNPSEWNGPMCVERTQFVG